MRSCWMVLALAGCGEVANDTPDAPAIDAPAGADASDAPPAPRCAGQPFAAPAPVAAVNSSGGEVGFRLSPDELTAVFLRSPEAAAVQLLIATRTSPTAQFSAPIEITVTGNTREIESPSITADGLTLYFASLRPGSVGSRDVWKATRATTSAQFGNIVAVTEVESTADESDVYAVPDGSAIYFSSSRNQALYSVFRAARQGTGFAAPVEVFEHRPQSVGSVVVSGDELTLFYQVGNDIYESNRTSTAMPFAFGIPPGLLNSPDADWPNWLSPDGCRLYFASDRAGGLGSFDIYVAARTPK